MVHSALLFVGFIFIMCPYVLYASYYDAKILKYWRIRIMAFINRATKPEEWIILRHRVIFFIFSFLFS